MTGRACAAKENSLQYDVNPPPAVAVDGPEVVAAAADDDAHHHAAARTRRKRFYWLAVWAGAGARATSVLTQVVTLYLAVRFLGPERYGMWATVSTLAVWLGIANFGLGNGLTTRIAECTGRNDPDAASAAISSAVAIVTAISLALLLALALPVLTVDWAHRVFNVTDPLAVAEARPTVVVVVVTILALLPLSIGGAVLAGHQLGNVVGVTSIVTSLLGLAALYVGTRLRVGMPTLAVCLLLPGVLADALQYLVARHLGFIRFSWRRVRWADAWSMLSLGGRFLALQVLAMFVFQTGAIIIAKRFGAADVTPYAVTYRLVMISNTVMAVLATPLIPAYGEAFARGDVDWVRRTFSRSARAVWVIWLPAAAILALAGKPIIRLWAGPAAVPDTLLLCSMLGFTFATGLGYAVSNLLNGLGQLSSQLWGAGIMAVLHIPLSLWLCRRVGIAGVAVSQTLLQCAISLPLAYAHAWRLLKHPPATPTPPLA